MALLGQKFKGIIEEDSEDSQSSNESKDEKTRQEYEAFIKQESDDEKEDIDIFAGWDTLRLTETQTSDEKDENFQSTTKFKLSKEKKDPFLKYGSGIMSFF